MKNSKIEEVEIVISKSLKVGVLLSATIIFLGLLLFLITGNSGYPDSSFPTSFLPIFQGLFSLKPYAIIMTGLFVLILTPIFRVGVSIFVFFKEKDYLYVKITSLVFAILIISFVLGEVE